MCTGQRHSSCLIGFQTLHDRGGVDIAIAKIPGDRSLRMGCNGVRVSKCEDRCYFRQGFLILKELCFCDQRRGLEYPDDRAGTVSVIE